MTAVVMLAAMTEFPAFAAETPTITAYISNDNTPTDDNSVLQELRRRLGVNLQIICNYGSDYKTKLNTMLATNSEPDMYNPDATIAAQLKQANRLLNMEPYLDEYGPDIKAAYGDKLHEAPLNKDGVYALFNLNRGDIPNLCIRKDWLAAVGREMPTTTDELYDVLRAFAYEDPDGNGLNDTFGLAPSLSTPALFSLYFAAFGVHMSSWGFTQNSVLLEDGTVTTALKHPRFLEAITFLNRLYHERIMDPDFATLTGMQGYERLWNGKVGTISFQSTGVTNNWYPGRYTFEVPENPGDLFGFAVIDGHGAPKSYPNLVDPNWVINAKTKYPELCVKTLNYISFNNEGQELTYLGVEGKHFEWIDKENGKYRRIGIYTDDVAHRADGGFVYYIALTKTAAADRLYNKTTRDAQDHEDEVGLEWPYIAVNLDSVVECDPDLQMCVKECVANLIVSDGDLEKELDEYIKRWEGEGGLRVEADATAAYNAEHGQ